MSKSAQRTVFADITHSGCRDEMEDVLLFMRPQCLIAICERVSPEIRAEVMSAAEVSLRPSPGSRPACRAAGSSLDTIVHCDRAWGHGGLHAWWDYNVVGAIWGDEQVPRRQDAPSNVAGLRRRLANLGLSPNTRRELLSLRSLEPDEKGWRLDVVLSDGEAEAYMSGTDVPKPRFRTLPRSKRYRPALSPNVLGGHPQPSLTVRPGMLRVEVRVTRVGPSRNAADTLSF